MSARLAGDAGGVSRAVAILAGGGIVAIPTDTVYGLAADAESEAAVARIYSMKGRSGGKALIAHVTGLSMAQALAEFDEVALDLAARFWPGPLTLVVPARADCPVAAGARGGLATIGVRAPAHPLALAVIAGLGRAVAAPSANIAGGDAPTRAEAVALDVPVLDGGATAHGLASTIVEVAGGRETLLRAGAIAADTLGVMLDGVRAPRSLGE